MCASYSGTSDNLGGFRFNEISEDLRQYMMNCGYQICMRHGQRITQRFWSQIINSPRDNCEVYFSGVPINALEETMFPIFYQYGKIIQMRLLKDASRNNETYGFTVYETLNETIAALQHLNGCRLEGNIMSVHPSVRTNYLLVKGVPIHIGLENLKYIITKEDFAAEDLFIPAKVNYITNKDCCFIRFKRQESAIRAKHCIGRNLSKEFNCKIGIYWARIKEFEIKSAIPKMKTVFMRSKGLKKLNKQSIIDIINGKLAENKLQNVKVLNNLAFASFVTHAAAAVAVRLLDGRVMNDDILEATLVLHLDKRTRQRERERKELRIALEMQKKYRRERKLMLGLPE